MSDKSPLEPNARSLSAAGGSAKRPWWLRLLGVRRRQGRWLRIAPTKWGVFLIAVVVLGVGFVAFAEYSMHPDFCRSCHIMEPYYEAWHESTHSNVACGDCHFEPGWRHTFKGKWQATSQAVRYITDTYGSKPHAEVRDASCLREGCHERRVLEGNVNWTVKTQRGTDITIRFDHTPHLSELRRGKKLRCVSCHSQIVQGQHIVVTLDTCFLCHFKGLEHGRDEQTLGGCRACHDAPKQEIRLATGMFKHADYIDREVQCQSCHVDAVSGDGAVPRQICWTCHNSPRQMARYGETRFIHQNHVTDHKVECSSCHVQIVHHLTATDEPGDNLPGAAGHSVLSDSGSCGRCHQNLHNASLDLYRGHGGRGVTDMPSAMYRAQVDCIACHRMHQRGGTEAGVAGQTFVAAQQACDDCHGSKYSDRLVEWKTAVTGQLERAEQAVQDAQALLLETKMPSTRQLELRRLLDDAAHNVRFVKHAYGVHNFTYATALLNAAIDNSAKVTAAIRGDRATAEASP